MQIGMFTHLVMIRCLYFKRKDLKSLVDVANVYSV
jgi:hypothetical protein